MALSSGVNNWNFFQSVHKQSSKQASTHCSDRISRSAFIKASATKNCMKSEKSGLKEGHSCLPFIIPQLSCVVTEEEKRYMKYLINSVTLFCFRLRKLLLSSAGGNFLQ